MKTIFASSTHKISLRIFEGETTCDAQCVRRMVFIYLASVAKVFRCGKRQLDQPQRTQSAQREEGGVKERIFLFHS